MPARFKNTRMPAKAVQSDKSAMPARFDAILLGSLGCSKGGVARAEKLSTKHLSRIGKIGASARWS